MCRSARIRPSAATPLFAVALVLALGGVTPAGADDTADPRPGERGLPPVTLIPSSEIGAPQLFAVSTAGRRLYVATLAGVAVFDGAHWTLAEAPRAVYAVHAAAARVIAGGPDALGELTRHDDGHYALRSLLDALPPGQRAIGDVRSIHAIGDVFFAVTDRALLRIAGTAVQVVEQWRSDPARRGFVSRQRLYVVSQAALRVYAAAGTAIADPLAGRHPRATRVSFVVDHAAAGQVVGVEDEGVFSVQDGHWRAVGEGAGNRLRHRLSDARVLDDGSVAILAAGVGVVLLAPDLSFDGVLSHAEGLPSGQLLGLAVDDEDGLWAAGESSLARIDLGAGLTRIDARLGLDGTVNAVVRRDDRLHVLTTTGLFTLEHPAGSRLRAARVAGVTGRTWAAIDGGDHLLVASADGVFERRADGVRRVPGTARLSAYALAPVDGDARRMLVGSRTGLSVLVRDGGGWRFERHVPSAPRYVRTIVPRPGGVVYVGTSFDGVVKLALTDGTATTISGGETTLREVDGAILVLSTDVPSLTRLDESSGTLVPLTRGRVAVPPHTVRFAAHPSGDLWMTGRGAVVDAAGGGGPRPVLDRNLTIQALHIESDGVVWLGGSSGLWRLAHGERHRAAPQPPTLEQVFVNGTAISRAGPGGAPIRLPHGIERLRLEFSPNSFSTAVITDFRLEPLDAQWNPTRRGQAAEYTSLPEGDYRLRIRSTEGAQQAETSWAFHVRPPWYRTPWAYLFEAIGGVALLLGVSQWRTRQLRRRSEELERAVIEKTAALQAANQRLAELAWRDELTGLHNRRHFDDALAEEWSRAGRAEAPLALVLADIDHFKRLNDSLGHVAGDRALKAVAGVIERCARRPGDVAARHGGDEFAVLLPGGRWERVHALAEEIREAVEALALPHPGHPLGYVTVSVGVTAVERPDAVEPTLIDAADRALYRAKASGRNAVAA